MKQRLRCIECDQPFLILNEGEKDKVVEKAVAHVARKHSKLKDWGTAIVVEEVEA